MDNVIVDHNNQGIFSIQVFIRTGSVYETKKEHGISHLLEHMMYKSKKDRTAKQLLLELVSMGGVFNAITNKDYTSFYIRAVEQNWKQCVDILHSVVYDAHFKSDELETEKKVVVEEFMLYEDDIKDVTFDMAYDAYLASNNPYRKSVKGSLDVITTATPRDLKRYHSQHYSSGIIFINCSKRLHKQAIARAGSKFQIRKHTFDAQGTNNMFRNLGVPIVHVINQSQRAQNSTIVMFKGFPYSDHRTITLDFVWDVLAGSLNSLLMLEVREKRGLVYGMSAFNEAYAAMGVTGIYFTSSSSDTHTIIGYITRILNNLKTTGLAEHVLKYSKSSYLNKLRYRLTDRQFADERAMIRRYYGCAWDEKDIINRLERLSNKQIESVCSKVFDMMNICVVSIGKYSDVEKTRKKITNAILS